MDEGAKVIKITHLDQEDRKLNQKLDLSDNYNSISDEEELKMNEIEERRFKGKERGSKTSDGRLSPRQDLNSD